MCVALVVAPLHQQRLRSVGQLLRGTRRGGIYTRLLVSHRSREVGPSVKDPAPSWSSFRHDCESYHSPATISRRLAGFGHYTHGSQGLHRANHPRPTARAPAWCTTRRSTHGRFVQFAWPHVQHRHGGGHAILCQRRTHLSSQRMPRLHGQKRREEKFDRVPPHQPRADQATTHKSSSSTSVATRTTHQHPP